MRGLILLSILLCLSKCSSYRMGARFRASTLGSSTRALRLQASEVPEASSEGSEGDVTGGGSAAERDDDAVHIEAVEAADGIEESEEEVEEGEGAIHEDDEVEIELEEQEEEQKEEPEPTPLEKAIAEKEAELQKKLIDLEAKLRAERISSSKIKDRLSESGKTGFFMVQAQVAEFLKKKDIEQKARVKKNKREFVSMILPVVDAFYTAPVEYPATTEKEENMHKSFGSLVSSIMIVFEKYGVKEYVFCSILLPSFLVYDASLSLSLSLLSIYCCLPVFSDTRWRLTIIPIPH